MNMKCQEEVIHMLYSTQVKLTIFGVINLMMVVVGKYIKQKENIST